MLDHAWVAARASALLSQMHGRPIIHSGLHSLEGDEGPLLLIDGTCYHWLWLERGQESCRKSTRDPDELLFWLLEESAFGGGVAFEVANRNQDQDSRRLIHAHQRALFTRLASQWQARLEARIAELLSAHPYRDR